MSWLIIKFALRIKIIRLRVRKEIKCRSRNIACFMLILGGGRTFIGLTGEWFPFFAALCWIRSHRSR